MKQKYKITFKKNISKKQKKNNQAWASEMVRPVLPWPHHFLQRSWGNFGRFKMLLFDKKARLFFQENSISDVLKCEICKAFRGLDP